MDTDFVIDSDGMQHEICLQGESNDCAPACVFMVECIRKQQSMAGGEDRILYISGPYAGGARQ
jgi:hypothetical protein